MKKKNIISGIVCLALAAVIILVATGVLYFPFFAGISTLKLVATIIVGILIIGAIIDLELDGIIVFGGVLVMMYRSELGIDISLWVLIAVVVLLLMARNFLLPGNRKMHRWKINDNGRKTHCISNHEENQPSIMEEDGSYFYAKNRFNGMVKYITSDNFQRAEIDSEFGGVEVYFSNAKVPNGHCEVDLCTRFSGIELFIPRNWTVIFNVHNKMGEISESPIVLAEGEESPVVLTVKGEIRFGGVEINRV